MKETKKKRGILAQLLLAVVTITVLAAFAIVGMYAVWVVKLCPSFSLAAREVTLELGETFDPEKAIASVENASVSDIVIDDAGYVQDETGEYEIRYSMPPQGLFTRAGFLTDFFRGKVPDQSLTVRVEDTTAPELSVIEEPLSINLGDTVTVEQLVTSASDNAGEGALTVTLSDGSSQYTFDEPGTCEVRITAADPSGNETEATATVIVIAPDTKAPVLKGVKDTAVAVGTAFDVMEGVTAEDDRDEKPKIKAKPKKIDTSAEGIYTIKYTARDADGNKTTAKRTVIVAGQVASYEGGSYPVRWDTAGIPNQPYLVAVNRTWDAVTVYQQNEAGRYEIPVKAFICSTGPRTPVGVFRTRERYRWKYLFENSWGQFATRIINHILFHSVPYEQQNPATLEYNEYNLLGTPASLGCIRLRVCDAQWIYENCPEGFTCVIYEDALTPGPLGKPRAAQIDTSDPRCVWDPTDPDVNNPWKQGNP